MHQTQSKIKKNLRKKKYSISLRINALCKMKWNSLLGLHNLFKHSRVKQKKKSVDFCLSFSKIPTFHLYGIEVNQIYVSQRWSVLGFCIRGYFRFIRFI